MQNEQKEYVDLYVPKKCYATNRLINSKDYASVQVTLSDANLERTENEAPLTVVLSGFVRSKGNADAALNK